MGTAGGVQLRFFLSTQPGVNASVRKKVYEP